MVPVVTVDSSLQNVPGLMRLLTMIAAAEDAIIVQSILRKIRFIIL